jgi:hypothetical protein
LSQNRNISRKLAKIRWNFTLKLLQGTIFDQHRYKSKVKLNRFICIFCLVLRGVKIGNHFNEKFTILCWNTHGNVNPLTVKIFNNRCFFIYRMVPCENERVNSNYIVFVKNSNQFNRFLEDFCVLVIFKEYLL